jgi:hypothetical protein
MIDTDDHSEVLSAAVLRIRTTPEAVLRWMRGGDDWRRQPWVVQTGRLGRPPAPRDLETLTLDASDIRDLARCRVGRCGSESHRAVPNRISVSAAEANRPPARSLPLRGRHTAPATRPLSNIETTTIPSTSPPGSTASSPDPLSAETAPDLAAYLVSVPGRRPRMPRFLYWMKEKFWRTGVLSLNHCVIVDRRPLRGSSFPPWQAIYATHYYEASLTTTMCSRRRPGVLCRPSIARARTSVPAASPDRAPPS